MPFHVDEKDILQELEDLGGSVNDDEVLLKMKELCLLYRKDACDLVSSWVAFASTSSLETDPTLEKLNRLEREVLSKQVTKVKPGRSTNSSFNLIPPVYNAETIDMSDGLGNSYKTPERKSSFRRINESEMGKTVLDGSPRNIFSPNSSSPSSVKYSGRTGKGDVICSHGASSNVNWMKVPGTVHEVKLLDDKNGLKNSYEYMFEKLHDRCGILNDMIEDMAQVFQEKYDLDDFAHIRIQQVGEINVVGRICCDGDGKMNATSVLLEGSLEISSGHVVPVDLSRLSKFALFPGQIVAGKAVNSDGTKLVMTSLLEGVMPAFPTEPMKVGPDPLDIVVASGPFTTSDSLSFEPLLDLLAYVKKHNPDVLILIGPFVDCNHGLIQKGGLNDTYEELFQNQVMSIQDSLTGCPVQVVLIPSLRDIHHHVIYPTPPFELNAQFKGTPVFCAPDPCLLNISGLVIGVTSVDILFHLGKEEISHPPGLSDRLGRLANHLLTQRSFYPLHPPLENVNVDYEHLEMYAKLTVCPHILITPSDLRCFVKDIHGCCCINPEHLAKGLCGGSFARIRVQPCEQKDGGSLIDNIIVDIVRV